MAEAITARVEGGWVDRDLPLSPLKCRVRPHPPTTVFRPAARRW